MSHAINIYGDFGTGKTTLAIRLAKKLLSNGEKVRLVTAENTMSIKEHIDSGFVEVFHVEGRDHPFDTLRKAVDGWWPIEPHKPEVSKLVAPTAATFEEYPLWMYEGTTTLSSYLDDNLVLGGLRQRSADGESIGINEPNKIRFTDGDVTVGGNSQVSYGIIQSEMVSLIKRSQRLRSYTIWTSHSDIIYQQIVVNGRPAQGRPLYGGPEVFGGALTGSIGKEFADVWRIGTTEVEVEGTKYTERRLYVKEHRDSDIPWKAKNSAGDERQDKVPDYFALTAKGLPKRNEAREIDIADRIVQRLWA